MGYAIALVPVAIALLVVPLFQRVQFEALRRTARRENLPGECPEHLAARRQFVPVRNFVSRYFIIKRCGTKKFVQGLICTYLLALFIGILLSGLPDLAVSGQSLFSPVIATWMAIRSGAYTMLAINSRQLEPSCPKKVFDSELRRALFGQTMDFTVAWTIAFLAFLILGHQDALAMPPLIAYGWLNYLLVQLVINPPLKRSKDDRQLVENF
jgi:hypothetical protein